MTAKKKKKNTFNKVIVSLMGVCVIVLGGSVYYIVSELHQSESYGATVLGTVKDDGAEQHKRVVAKCDAFNGCVSMKQTEVDELASLEESLGYILVSNDSTLDREKRSGSTVYVYEKQAETGTSNETGGCSVESEDGCE